MEKQVSARPVSLGTQLAVVEADKRLLAVLTEQQKALKARPDLGSEINRRVSEAILKCAALHRRGSVGCRELTELEAIAGRLGVIK